VNKRDHLWVNHIAVLIILAVDMYLTTGSVELEAEHNTVMPWVGMNRLLHSPIFQGVVTDKTIRYMLPLYQVSITSASFTCTW
jgi:hypothetical protein